MAPELLLVGALAFLALYFCAWSAVVAIFDRINIPS